MTLLAERPDHVDPARVVDFDVYGPEGLAADFHEAWRVLHAPGVPDLIWTPRQGGHWIATRGPLIARMYAEHEQFSSRVRMVPRALFEGMRMIPESLDPPEHGPYRQLLNVSLAPSRIIRLEPRIRALAASLVAGLVPAGHCDFVTQFAHILPIHIFLGICDLPLEDATLLKKMADSVTHPDGVTTPAAGYQALRDYLLPHVRTRRGGTGEDLLSAIVNGRLGDAPMSEDEGLLMAGQVLLGGLDTVASVLGFLQLFLAQSPAHRRQLIDDPSLAPRAVEELLRRFAVLFLGREVRDDMIVDGVTLRRGDLVILPTALFGMDAGENDRPLDVDFTRPTVTHCSFGRGSHRCPGAHLARLEMRIAIEEWLARIPEFGVAPDAAVRFRGGIVGTLESLPLVW